MSNSHIENAALALPDVERADLALKLLDSLHTVGRIVATDEEWRAAWVPELQRRMHAVRTGSEPLLDADEVFAELEAELTGERGAR